MILKKTVVAIGVLGLLYGGEVLAAGAMLSTLYCAQWIHCDNSTSCHMTGDMSSRTYLDVPAKLQNNTRALPFISASATNIKKGEFECNYATQGNWPSYGTFFSTAKTRLQPLVSNVTNWFVNNDNQGQCGGSAKDCPLIPAVSQLRK